MTGYVVSSSGGGSILAGGTDIGNHCDDCTTTITLPFPVTIYDQAATTATVSSNGTVQFTAPISTEYRNGALPTAIFYPAITIIFRVENPGEHYHVPLLLSPYGYSTYRGS